MKTTEGKCSSCCRAPSDPYRRIVDGKIIEGCVDRAHDAAMVGIGSSQTWHHSKAGKEIRAREKAWLLSMFSRREVKEILSR